MAMNFTHLTNDPGAAIDAYWEYSRIVGDDDGGTPFSPAEYEQYRKRVIPLRLNNRLYVAWTNPSGMDCKLIGPETPCFCKHRYKQHKTDLEAIPQSRPINVPCLIGGCRCSTFRYIPTLGSGSLRCSLCKHFADDHEEKLPNKCSHGGCKCGHFQTSYSCSCGTSSDQHVTLVETKEERAGRGHPVGQDVPYRAMGGITGFSSLAEGYQRLDPSGIGAPPEAFLNEPITSSDHPFLRANVEAISQYHAQKAPYVKMAPPSERVVDPDRAERESARRRPEETDDMDYFERRYQERRKNEAKLMAQAATSVSPYHSSLTTGKRPAVKGAPPKKPDGSVVQSQVTRK